MKRLRQQSGSVLLIALLVVLVTGMLASLAMMEISSTARLQKRAGDALVSSTLTVAKLKLEATRTTLRDELDCMASTRYAGWPCLTGSDTNQRSPISLVSAARPGSPARTLVALPRVVTTRNPVTGVTTTVESGFSVMNGLELRAFCRQGRGGFIEIETRPQGVSGSLWEPLFTSPIHSRVCPWPRNWQ